MSKDTLVSTEPVSQGIIAITLARPDKRNALSIALMEQLCAAIETAETEPATRVLILRGAGPVFCAGLDLVEASDAQKVSRSAHLVARSLKTLRQSRLISIAAVHGEAVAGGAGLITACDLVVLEQDARIGYPEVHRGLVAALVSKLLCAQVPERIARELLLLGEMIDADRARAIGLANRVVPSGCAFDEATAMARQVLRGGPIAIVKTKQLVNQHAPSQLAGDLELAEDEHLAMRRSAEATEGLAAFFEKRPPNWTPKGK